jgi:hypothetical protein
MGLDSHVRCACYTPEFAAAHPAELHVVQPGCDPAATRCAVPANPTP